MQDDDGYGFSEHTYLKQQHFKGILKMHLRITQAVFSNQQWAKPPYYYFDLNSGPGVYKGEDGSPLIFLKCANALAVDYSAVFIEINEDRYNQLIENIKLYQDVKVFLGNYNDIIPQFLGYSNRNKLGLLYSDETGKRPPFELLSKVASDYQRLDLLIYLSATNIKRIRRSPKTDLLETLIESIEKIDKKMWIVREPIAQHQWMFLIGSNWDNFPTWKKQGFYRINSKKGREILRYLTFTKDELEEQRQLRLFP